MAQPGRVFFDWKLANTAYTSAWARCAHPTVGVTKERVRGAAGTRLF